MNKGRLYAFEGIDAAGKTTLIKYVAAELEKRGEKFAIQVYPSMRSVGKLIREAALNPFTVSGPSFLPLFIADALDCEQQINQWLDNDYTVLTDRSPILSTMVYQTEVFPLEYVFSICRPAMFIPSNAVFVMDVPASVSVERLTQRRGTPDRFEAVSLSRIEGRRGRYNSLWSYMHNVVYLDGTKVVTDNVNTVLTSMDKVNEIILSKN